MSFRVTPADLLLKRRFSSNSSSPSHKRKTQMNTEDNLVHKLHPELILMVLDSLNYVDRTGKCSLAILNLALTSRLYFKLVSRWASSVVNADFNIMLSFENDTKYWPTQLAALCKRLYGLCITCNNRSQCVFEMFSKLQLCHVCDAIRVGNRPSVNRHRPTDD